MKSETHLQETIEKSKNAFYESEAEGFLSGTEFLYQQSKYIHKRWWFLQGALLLLLWLLLQWSQAESCTQKCMGVASPLFAVLILPELWKNRSTCSVEIEDAAYFSLRQIYAARILFFALADVSLLCVFTSATVLTGKMLLEELMIQFFLPYFVTCCICFRTFYSPRMTSEVFAFFLCIIWCAVWSFFVLNEHIYNAISLPAWLAATAMAALYLGFCIYRGQRGYGKQWEEMTV